MGILSGISNRNYRNNLFGFGYVKKFSYCLTITNSHNQCVKSRFFGFKNKIFILQPQIIISPAVGTFIDWLS